MGGLIARVYGKHRSIVYINGKTLEDAKYVLKTQFKVMESFYKHCILFPIYDSGQGAGKSPGIWCCISSLTFDCYEETANGATFCSPDGLTKCQIYMIGFVDDTSGSTNDFMQPEQKELDHYIQMATDDAQTWNDDHTTGAALNKQKCSYHFLNYDFTLSGIPFAKVDMYNPVISIRFYSEEHSKPMKQLGNYQPHKTLGV